MWVPNLPTAILGGAVATISGVCIFKDWYSGPPFDRKAKAYNQTVIITGANSGIGERAAWEFAWRGAKVFMACRDMRKCEAKRRQIVLETENRYVYCRPCDLSSLQSVTDFVRRFKSEEPALHVLVNNAGLLAPPPPANVTKEGFEAHFGVNHLAHFLLTNLLLDTLKASAPSRVVVVSSSAHYSGHIDKDRLTETDAGDANAAYAMSKLANVLFARELGRRMLDQGVAVIAVDPSLADTELNRNLSMMKSITRFLVYPLFWPFMKNAHAAAQVIVHAALDPKLADCAGDYFVDMEKREPSKEAQSYEVSQWLWRLSEKWTRLEDRKASLNKALAA